MDDIDTEKIKSLMQTDPAAAAEAITEHIENKNNTPLNFAITGESGAGKSTFVNYFREMDNDEEGAAPTGCTETTFESSSYPHPMYPNVILWDLPGIGTTSFPADEYLETMEFEKFDFFIIISNTRFRENDVKLAKAIDKLEKKFYFVRSKIDNDVDNEKKGKKNFNEKEMLKKIREDCIQGLQKEGFESPQVFLISSYDLKLYDFPLLHETLERELPEHKSRTFLMSMPNINLEVINKKKKALQSQIKFYAAASAAGAVLPIPGLSIAVDLPLMVKAVTTFVVSFGLDIKSLDKLADKTGVPVTDLKAQIKSPLAAVEITKTRIVKCFGQMGNVALNTVTVVAKSIPILFGIPATMALSSTATHKALNHILNILADDAQRVFERSLHLNSPV